MEGVDDMEAHQRNDSDALLADASWLKRVARALVGDAHRADDLVQEAHLAALGRGERVSGQGRAWVFTVLRNALRQERRSEGRRRDREWFEATEGRVAGVEPSASETLDRLGTQRAVLDALEALPEPYRTTLVLRFLDGHPVREIAKRMKAPSKTVHTRIQRGLGRMRSLLDEQPGGRNRWLSALLPLARRGPIEVLASAGAVMMKLEVLGVLGVASLGVVGVWALRDTGPDAPGALVALGTEGGEDATLGSEGGEPVGSDREGIEATPHPGSGKPVDSHEGISFEAPAALVGSVVGLDEQPLEGLTVAFELAEGDDFRRDEALGSAITDATGVFTMLPPDERGRLSVVDEGWSTLLHTHLDGYPEDEPRLVAAPSMEFGGRVADPEGVPIEGAELRLYHDAALVRELRRGRAVSSQDFPRLRTDPDGGFRFGGIPTVPGTRVSIRAAGFETADLDVPGGSELGFEVVLEPMEITPHHLTGRVLDEAGHPLMDIWVGSPEGTDRSGADGTFVVDYRGTDGALEVSAVREGWLSATASVELPRPPNAPPIELQFTRPALTIVGRVADATGHGLQGIPVFTTGGSMFGDVVLKAGGVEYETPVYAEDVMGGLEGNLLLGRSTRSETGGGFELTALLDRPYDLVAAHPIDLRTTRIHGIDAGSRDVELRFAEDAPRRKVAGQVVDLDGVPIPGVQVRAGRRVPLGGGPQPARLVESVRKPKTDGEGRFEFPPMVHEDCVLLVSGGDLAPSPDAYPVEDFANPEDLRIRVPRICHLQVILDADRTDVRWIRLLDADGNRLRITLEYGGLTMASTMVSIEPGPSEIFVCDQRATTLLLLSEEGEVQRVDLNLVPGEVTSLHP